MYYSKLASNNKGRFFIKLLYAILKSCKRLQLGVSQLNTVFVLCFGLITLSANADVTIEQSGEWSLFLQNNQGSKPMYILSSEQQNAQLSLACSLDTSFVAFSVRFFDVAKLHKASLPSNLSIQLSDKSQIVTFSGELFNSGNHSVSWVSNANYADRNNEQHSTQLISSYARLFEIMPLTNRNITIQSSNDNNGQYQATFNTNGLPVIFKRFTQLCGTTL
ncbi:hypothetical protein RHO13_10705 [Orbus wheelerorum]|uniref:hypothetical protein n=1 Tax=Orbus wheelerorum TaxID=3074111 RepID=UPI00370DD575